jgi:hypothetical protein
VLAQSPAEITLVNVWFLACALGGLLCLVFGPRALGLGLWGALVGAVIGIGAVASSIDALPNGAVVGASIGLFVGGLLGLPMRPRLSALAAGCLAFAAALGTIAVWETVHLGATVPCNRALCFPEWTPTFSPYAQQLLAADGAFVVLLCVWEAWGARAEGRSGPKRSTQSVSGAPT